MTESRTREGSVQDQIDNTKAEAVLTARASMSSREAAPFCTIRGHEIPEDRRRAVRRAIEVQR